MINYTIKKCDAKEFQDLGGIVGNSKFKSQANYFLALDDGKIIGILGYANNFFIGRGRHLFGGSLKVEIERNGIGSSLILAFEEEARQHNIPLVIHRFSDNGKFYEKMGYHVDYDYNEAWKHLK